MGFVGSINTETRKWLGNQGHAFERPGGLRGLLRGLHGGTDSLPVRFQGQDLGE
jgi:hypothetical protein